MNPVSPGTTVFEAINNEYVEWYVSDVIFTGGETHAILDRGDRQATVPVAELETAIEDTSTSRWVPAIFDGDNEAGEPQWIPHPRRAADPDDIDTTPTTDSDDVHLRDAPDNPTDLTLKMVTGKGSLSEVNQFLNGGDDDLVFHHLGGVSSWKAAFVAYHHTAIVSVLTLHHYNPSTNGEEIAITRLANHPSAPHNTSSWMIARAREWAERAGYDRIAAYAGVDENTGTCYKAAGFERDGEPVERDGTRWDGNQKSADQQQTWTRAKFVDTLSPAVYASKSEQWATETVVDEITSPDENTVGIGSLLAMHDQTQPKTKNVIGSQVTF